MPETFKHKDFVCEPMAKKTVYKVPGIGQAIGGKMCDDGIDTAEKLYEIYRGDPKAFMEKVKSYGGNRDHQEAAYAGMRDYARERS